MSEDYATEQGRKFVQGVQEGSRGVVSRFLERRKQNFIQRYTCVDIREYHRGKRQELREQDIGSFTKAYKFMGSFAAQGTLTIARYGVLAADVGLAYAWFTNELNGFGAIAGMIGVHALENYVSRAVFKVPEPDESEQVIATVPHGHSSLSPDALSEIERLAAEIDSLTRRATQRH